MTTPEAATRYEAEHLDKMKGKGYTVFNPENKPISELPVIYGFNNGGGKYFWQAVLLAEDGTQLGSHLCSSEGYMRHDLGILEGTRPDRHETFKAHYPGGYKMDFITYSDAKNHAGLKSAIAKAEGK